MGGQKCWWTRGRDGERPDRTVKKRIIPPARCSGGGAKRGSQQFRDGHNHSGGASKRIESRTGSVLVSPQSALTKGRSAPVFFHALGHRPKKEDAGAPQHLLSGTEIRQGRALSCSRYSGIMGARRNSNISFQAFFIPTDAFPPTYFLFLVLEGEAVNAQL